MAARSIPWLRVFVEGLVIVGSILLAFGLRVPHQRGSTTKEALMDRQLRAAIAILALTATMTPESTA